MMAALRTLKRCCSGLLLIALVLLIGAVQAQDVSEGGDGRGVVRLTFTDTFRSGTNALLRTSSDVVR